MNPNQEAYGRIVEDTVEGAQQVPEMIFQKVLLVEVFCILKEKLQQL